ncbi:MAG TPA: hypothetical protein VEX64_08305, partial [Pyrinomonadaceae bacterium]|nr:hypothetical protein [Pyrinomonadaceae bacterium]
MFSSLSFGCSGIGQKEEKQPLAIVRTLAGSGENRFGEVFGIAVNNEGSMFISDGAKGSIWRIERDAGPRLITDKLDTPSALAIDKEGFLIVADTGSHTIKRINAANGEISLIAGTEKRFGFQDGAASSALFNAPVGLAIGTRGEIIVADTYNDHIRVVENGSVFTLAGGEKGFADGPNAKFDTP